MWDFAKMLNLSVPQFLHLKKRLITALSQSYGRLPNTEPIVLHVFYIFVIIVVFLIYVIILKCYRASENI